MAASAVKQERSSVNGDELDEIQAKIIQLCGEYPKGGFEGRKYGLSSATAELFMVV